MIVPKIKENKDQDEIFLSEKRKIARFAPISRTKCETKLFFLNLTLQVLANFSISTSFIKGYLKIKIKVFHVSEGLENIITRTREGGEKW